MKEKGGKREGIMGYERMRVVKGGGGKRKESWDMKG